MPTDRAHHVELRPSIMARALGAGCELAVARPWLVIGASVALALAALAYTGLRLGYRTSRLDLVGSGSDFTQLWQEYLDEFGADDDAVIVVEGSGPAAVRPVMTDLGQQLAQQPRLFHEVLHEVNLAPLRAKGLFYLPPAELESIDGFLAQTEPIVRGQWSAIGLAAMAGGLVPRLTAPGAHAAHALADAERLAAGLQAALTQGAYVSPWPALGGSLAAVGQSNYDPLLMNDGKLGFVLLRLANAEDANFARSSEAIDELRRVIAKVQGRHAEVRIGLTGLPVMESDEMRCGQTSMLEASLVSFVGVAILSIAGFGGLRHPVAANLVLLFGMAWSYGYVTLVVGHLNIISMAFSVTLIGIGVDYGIHYVARYLQLRGDGVGCDDALRQTSRGVGPAIMTGAVTTAVAFFTTAMTEFRGVAELGIIAGGGLMLCAAAELLVLPAVVSLMDQAPVGGRMPVPLPIHRWFQPLLAAPRQTLLAVVAASTLMGVGVQKLWYDHNLLNLQPVGTESVALEKKLLDECKQSLWYALSVANSREELLARKAAFAQLPSIERTEEIVSLLADGAEQKRPIVARIAERLAGLPAQAPTIPVDAPEKLSLVLDRLEQTLAQTPGAERCRAAWAEAIRLWRAAPQAQALEALARYQQHAAGELLGRLHIVAGMAGTEPPQLADLPPSLAGRFTSKSGEKYALRVYGRGSIWDMEDLQRFVAEVRSVDPRATGNPLHGYESSLQMKRSYEQAAIYALVVISVVLLIDFGNPLHALLASLPLGFGMLQTFGLMGWMNIPLNPANIIALPLILGLGVDYGVHLVHDYLHQSGRFRPSPSTMVAVVVDSLTTLVGFGSLMLSSHQGLQSLGRVLTIGVSFCLFNSVTLLPALLAIISAWRPEAQPEPAAAPTAVALTPPRIQPRRAPGAAPLPAARPAAPSGSATAPAPRRAA